MRWRLAGLPGWPAPANSLPPRGDYVVQYGIREGHWPGGSFRGAQIPAGDYAREVAFMYRLHRGRIAERWAVRDDLGMMQQLGASIAIG
jgi:hypothetical protein